VIASETFIGQTWAIDALKSLHPGCRQYFDKHKRNNQSMFEILANTISQTTFISASGTNAARRLDDLGITLQGLTTVQDVMDKYPIVGASTAFVIGTTVFLTERWERESTEGKKRSILHELLHLALDTAVGVTTSEVDLAVYLGMNRPANPNSELAMASASTFISNRLANGCPE
jgi:hypothetical protein